MTIYSRYEYTIDDSIPFCKIFEEYENLFESKYNEQGVKIEGVFVAIQTADRRAILLVYSIEAELILKLRFTNRTDVKINRYY